MGARLLFRWEGEIVPHLFRGGHIGSSPSYWIGSPRLAEKLGLAFCPLWARGPMLWALELGTNTALRGVVAVSGRIPRIRVRAITTRVIYGTRFRVLHNPHRLICPHVPLCINSPLDSILSLLVPSFAFSDTTLPLVSLPPSRTRISSIITVVVLLPLRSRIKTFTPSLSLPARVLASSLSPLVAPSPPSASFHLLPSETQGLMEEGGMMKCLVSCAP
ncbi:hypothetical protein PIB30_001343 [Stylosanthes scabra]|uniref:Uncharacterized protein n=1 Tax=Stylosanthes scabra TaxID=79078 RepID=A0ABU6Y2X7_9FABA|nr:hypothetical protein [Stylosanthes scabra]